MYMYKAYAFHFHAIPFILHIAHHTLSSTGIHLNLPVFMARGKTPILNCASIDLLWQETQACMYCLVSYCSLYLIYVLSLGLRVIPNFYL